MSNTFRDRLEVAMAECAGDSAFRMDKNRPYNGQSHTHYGERGKEPVKGLTMRDIADCMIRGFLAAGNVHKDNPVPDDVYQVDTDIDPIAMVQNTICEIERSMGIYPNVPELRDSND